MRRLDGIQFIAPPRQAPPDRVRNHRQRSAGDDSRWHGNLDPSSSLLRRRDRGVHRGAPGRPRPAPAPARVLGRGVRADPRADGDAGIQRRRCVGLLGARDHGDGLVRPGGDRSGDGRRDARARGVLRAADGPDRRAGVSTQLGPRRTADAGRHRGRRIAPRGHAQARDARSAVRARGRGRRPHRPAQPPRLAVHGPARAGPGRPQREPGHARFARPRQLQGAQRRAGSRAR